MGVRGLEGDLRVMPLTDIADRLRVGASVLVEGESEPRRITAFGGARQGMVIRLEGIASRDQATALIGRHLVAEAAPAVLPPGSYWWHELEGLAVVGVSGRSFGRVEEVFRAGGNEVYRVLGPGGELLVPALRSVVVEIDLDAGQMTIRDPAEWLEEA